MAGFFSDDVRLKIVNEVRRVTAEFEVRKQSYKRDYPHVLVESLIYNPVFKRYEADCKCTMCGGIHRRKAQDFWQCDLCRKCRRLDRNLRARERYSNFTNELKG